MERKVIRNAFWIIGCKVVKALLAVVVSIITARYFGKSDYGLINYAASVAAFFAPIMKLGFDCTLVQETVEHPESEGKIFGTGIILNLISGVLCIIGATSFAMIANFGEYETVIVCLLYSVMLIFQATEMIQYWFQAKLLSKYSSIAMLVSYCVLTAIQIALVAAKVGIYWFALSYSVDFLVISVILFIIYKKKCNQKLSFSREIGKRLWLNSRHFIISSLMVTIFSQTDRIMLELMIDNAAVGIYSAASTCASMASFVFVAIIDSVRPTVFEASDRESRNERISQLYSIIIYFSLFVSLIITLLAPLIIRILYGAEYLDSISVLQVAVWFTTFSYLGSIRNIWLLAEHKQKYLWVINLSGALMNIVLNLIFINLWGVIGAAFASVLTQIFTNIIVGFIIVPIIENNALMFGALNPKKCIVIVKDILRSIRR